MSYQYVSMVIIQKVTAIELSHAHRLNALNKVFIGDLMWALNDLSRAGICCIILHTPSGTKVFSAGCDTHELPTGRHDSLSYDDPLRQIIRIIQKYLKSVISIVEGSIWGNAFEMIMSSGLIIAASTSAFSVTLVSLGVPHNLVSIHNLTCDAGFHAMKELVFTTSLITTQRAMAVRIFNHIVPVEKLEDFTLQMVHHISEKTLLAVTAIKKELRVLGEAHTMNFNEFKHAQGIYRAVYDSEDHREGVNVFMEKRKLNLVGH